MFGSVNVWGTQAIETRKALPASRGSTHGCMGHKSGPSTVTQVSQALRPTWTLKEKLWCTVTEFRPCGPTTC